VEKSTRCDEYGCVSYRWRISVCTRCHTVLDTRTKYEEAVRTSRKLTRQYEKLAKQRLGSDMYRNPDDIDF